MLFTLSHSRPYKSRTKLTHRIPPLLWMFGYAERWISVQGGGFVQMLLLCYEGIDKSVIWVFKLCLQKFLWNIVVFF